MEYIRTATLEYPTGETARLEYDGRAGNLLVDGAETDRVTVQVVAHVFEESAEAADAVLDRIVAGIEHAGDTVRIAPPPIAPAGPWFLVSRAGRVDYEVTVPRRTACRLTGRSGRIEVARVRGPLEISQKSGRTSVRAVESDVRIASKSGNIEVEDVGGALVARAHSGRVLAARVQGDANVQSASGAVRVEHVGGNVSAHSASGRVEAVDVAGNATLETASGRLLLAQCRGSARLRSVSGAVRFQGPVLGDLDIAVTSGSIHLNVDPSRPFFVDAETQSGSIRSDLPRREGGPPPEGAPTVRLRSLSGAIRIGRAPTIDIDIQFGPRDVELGGWGWRRRVRVEQHMQREAEREARHAAWEAEREARQAEREARRAERHAEREARWAERQAARHHADQLEDEVEDDEEEEDEDDEEEFI